jgi:hypothetical protein
MLGFLKPLTETSHLFMDKLLTEIYIPGSPRHSQNAALRHE